MKTLLVVTVILVTLFVLCESRRHEDDQKYLPKKSHHSRSRLRGSHLKLREGGVKSLHDRWMKPPKVAECVKTKCGHQELCIANPKTLEEKCVDRKKFIEGRKLFRNFHKEKALKDHVTSDLIQKELGHAEHMKDVHDLLEDYNKNLKHSSNKVDIKAAMSKGQYKLTESLASGCKPLDMYDLKRRLVGWSVLQHTESRMEHHRKKSKKLGHLKKGGSRKRFGKKPSYAVDKKDVKKHDISKRSVHDTVQTESHHHCKCSKSVMWEFHKQDKNGDGSLEHTELAVIESNKMEPCLHPLFKSCDLNADKTLTHGEWCCCMADTIPPCFDKKRQSDTKFYVPNCDKEGYYHREQCLVDKSYCWCVDLNGNQIMDSKRAGRAKCGVYDPNGRLIKE